MKIDKQEQFAEILHIIDTARSNATKSVNAELINAYWNVGAYISTEIANANWGDKTVIELAAFIKTEYPTVKGYDRTGLYRMRKFYETYNTMAFVSTVLRQIQIANNETGKNG